MLRIHTYFPVSNTGTGNFYPPTPRKALNIECLMVLFLFRFVFQRESSSKKATIVSRIVMTKRKSNN